MLGGEHGLQPDEIISNVISSPLSYLLAFVGAFIWAAYCTVTAKYARGKNAITLFVLLTALTLWLKFLASDQQGENQAGDHQPAAFLAIKENGE